MKKVHNIFVTQLILATSQCKTFIVQKYIIFTYVLIIFVIVIYFYYYILCYAFNL